MKTIFITVTALVAISLAILTDFQMKDSHSPDSGFAVLELFTSQGCSSCPPADKVVGTYALSNNPNVMVLSFHVDYWNYIGWKDPFSKKEYTDRQRNYSESLPSTVYTPQLVINGKEALVGSSEAKISTLVNALTKDKRISLLAVSAIAESNQIVVKYNHDAKPSGENICFALVKKIETTNVKRGENSGRKLTNYNIVTDFKTVSDKVKSGVVQFGFGNNKIAADYQIIAFVQEAKSMHILSAAKTEIKTQ